MAMFPIEQFVERLERNLERLATTESVERVFGRSAKRGTMKRRRVAYGSQQYIFQPGQARYVKLILPLVSNNFCRFCFSFPRWLVGMHTNAFSPSPWMFSFTRGNCRCATRTCTLEWKANGRISFRAIRCADTTVPSSVVVTINERAGLLAGHRFKRDLRNPLNESRP